jgi:hypothetical protein
MALPRFAPNTSASAAAGVMKYEYASDNDTQHRVAGDRLQDRAHDRRVLGRREADQQDVQGQQHQTEADGNTSAVLDAGLGSEAEGQEADHEQDRSRRRDIERKRQDDQRGSDIRPQHDRQGRDQRQRTLCREGCGHQPGGRAALEQRGQSESGGEGRETIAQGVRQQPAQVGAEGTRNAALDHVQAPEQQRDATHQIKNYDRGHWGNLQPHDHAAK